MEFLIFLCLNIRLKLGLVLANIKKSVTIVLIKQTFNNIQTFNVYILKYIYLHYKSIKSNRFNFKLYECITIARNYFMNIMGSLFCSKFSLCIFYNWFDTLIKIYLNISNSIFKYCLGYTFYSLRCCFYLHHSLVKIKINLMPLLIYYTHIKNKFNVKVNSWQFSIKKMKSLLKFILLIIIIYFKSRHNYRYLEVYNKTINMFSFNRIKAVTRFNTIKNLLKNLKCKIGNFSRKLINLLLTILNKLIKLILKLSKKIHLKLKSLILNLLAKLKKISRSLILKSKSILARLKILIRKIKKLIKLFVFILDIYNNLSLEDLLTILNNPLGYIIIYVTKKIIKFISKILEILQKMKGLKSKFKNKENRKDKKDKDIDEDIEEDEDN